MIKILEITNFKAFAHADIRLASYTLLSGLNSSGKSTVLQALALLRQGYMTGDDFGPLGHFRGVSLNGELVELGTGQDVLHEDYAAAPGTLVPRRDRRRQLHAGLAHRREEAVHHDRRLADLKLPDIFLRDAQSPRELALAQP